MRKQAGVTQHSYRTTDRPMKEQTRTNEDTDAWPPLGNLGVFVLHAVALFGVLAAALLCAAEGLIPTVPYRYIHLIPLGSSLMLGVYIVQKTKIPLIDSRLYGGGLVHFVALTYIVGSISAMTTIGVSGEADRIFPITPVWLATTKSSVWPLIFWRMGVYSTVSLTVLIIVRNLYIGYIQRDTLAKDT